MMTIEEIRNNLLLALDLCGDGGFRPFTKEQEDELIDFVSGLKDNNEKTDIENACDAYCKCCETKDCIEENVCKEDCFFRREYRNYLMELMEK